MEHADSFCNDRHAPSRDFSSAWLCQRLHCCCDHEGYLDNMLAASAYIHALHSAEGTEVVDVPVMTLMVARININIVRSQLLKIRSYFKMMSSSIMSCVIECQNTYIHSFSS